jgi:hypothetical protein
MYNTALRSTWCGLILSFIGRPSLFFTWRDSIQSVTEHPSKFLQCSFSDVLGKGLPVRDPRMGTIQLQLLEIEGWPGHRHLLEYQVDAHFLTRRDVGCGECDLERRAVQSVLRCRQKGPDPRSLSNKGHDQASTQESRSLRALHQWDPHSGQRCHLSTAAKRGRRWSAQKGDAIDSILLDPQSFVFWVAGLYHGSRSHLSLGKDSPDGRAVEPPEMGQIVMAPRSAAFIIDTSEEPPKLPSPAERTTTLPGLARVPRGAPSH